MRYFNLFLLSLFFLSSCSSTKPTATTRTSEQALYEASIEDAMAPTLRKISTNLVAINANNNQLVRKTIDGQEYLLVVTWKQNISYYEPYLDSAFYNTGKYPIWVTTAPELQQRMQQENAADVDLRLKQLLGLPPTSVYSYFVEMWVKPQDLFRPCPDNEISDNQCALCFPENAEPAYKTWINENRISRYYPCELYEKYPWTQLGYTYDWNPKNTTHVGLSEFVIKNNSQVKIKAILKTAEYLK